MMLCGVMTSHNFLGRRRRPLSACRDKLLLLLPLPALAYMFQLFRLRDEVESKKKMKRRQKRMREKVERDKEKKEQEQEQAMEGTKDAQGKLLSVRANSNCSLMHHPPFPISVSFLSLGMYKCICYSDMCIFITDSPSLYIKWLLLP